MAGLEQAPALPRPAGMLPTATLTLFRARGGRVAAAGTDECKGGRKWSRPGVFRRRLIGGSAWRVESWSGREGPEVATDLADQDFRGESDIGPYVPFVCGRRFQGRQL